MDEILFLSIITPVYNGAKYLGDYFNSWINQTYPHFEVILVDDGSEDNSRTLINEFIQLDKRFRLICQTHGGISKALDRGVQEAKHNYIVLMDQDDMATPNRLEETVKAFQHGAEVVMSAYELVDHFGKPIGKKMEIPIHILEGNILLENLKRNYFLGSAMAFYYKRDFQFNPLSGGTTDYDIALKMMINGYKFHYIPIVLLKYRIHQFNTSANYQIIRKNALDVLYQYDEQSLLDHLLLKGNGVFEVHLTLGILSLFKGKTELADFFLHEAEVNYNASVHSGHLELELMFYLGVYYYKNRNLEKSLDYLMITSNMDQLNASVANNIGVLKALNEEYTEAEKWFIQAININKDYLDVKENLKSIQCHNNQFIFTERLMRNTLLHSYNITGR